MAAPTVTPLPTAPARNVADPEEYIGVADTWAAALPTFGAEVQAAGEYANAKALLTAADAIATAADRAQTGLDRTAAANSATAAANSATAAAGSASTSAGWKSTSTTSMALTAGSKTLTIEAAKQFTAGTDIKVKRTSAPTTSYAYTTVSTYNSSTGELTFTLSSDLITGSGTYTDWTVELSGGRGATGAGDVNGPASATNNALVAFNGTTGKLVKDGPTYGTSGANKLLQLDASGKLPAVDGSQLTGLPAAGLTLVTTVTASNSTAAEVTGLDGTYDHYIIIGDDVQADDNSDRILYAQMQIGGSWKTSSYYCQYIDRSLSTATPTNGTTTSYVYMGPDINNGTDRGSSFVMHITKPALSSSRKMVWAETISNGYYGTVFTHSAADWNGSNTAGAMTGVRFIIDGGYITGSFRLYGFKK